MSGIIEVRGIVNKDGTMSFGEFTQFDNEFGKIWDRFTIFRPSNLWAYTRILSWNVQRFMCKS